MKEKLADKRHQLIDKGQDMIHKWEERSKDFIGGFLDLFGREGKFVSLTDPPLMSLNSV